MSVALVNKQDKLSIQKIIETERRVLEYPPRGYHKHNDREIHSNDLQVVWYVTRLALDQWMDMEEKNNSSGAQSIKPDAR